ncbi:hypothetical protein ACOJBO_10720 [Rhizobium beringeri]
MVSIKNTFNSKELEGGESGSSAQSATPAMETSTAIGRGPEETFKLPDDDPRAWILQYAPDDRVARWTREATSGSILA